MPDITQWAALAAAGTGAASVTLQLRSAARASQSWARDQGLDALRRALNAARFADEFGVVLFLKKSFGYDLTDEDFAHGREAKETLDEAITDLELFASPELIEAAWKMSSEVSAIEFDLKDQNDLAVSIRNPTPPSGGGRAMFKMRQEFLRSAKAEFGIYERGSWRRSLRGLRRGRPRRQRTKNVLP